MGNSGKSSHIEFMILPESWPAIFGSSRCLRQDGRRIIETEAGRSDAKSSWHSRSSICIMPVVLCNDSEIEVADGEVCQICGQVLEEFDEVTGTGIHGYYHWTCVCHTDA